MASKQLGATIVVTVVVLGVVAAVGGYATCSSGSAGGAKSDATKQRADLATVEGVVRLAKGSEPPLYPERVPGFGTNEERPQAENCKPFTEQDRRPMKVGKGRGLSNVLVSVTEFSEAPPHDSVKHRITIEGCRLTPPLVAATKGDSVLIVNESDYPFLPTLGSRRFMQALQKGQSREIALDRGGTQSLRCGFAAPCGRTEVIVQYHPVHTVTGADGTFRIENVPPGEEVVVHAWHPMLKEAKQSVGPVSRDKGAEVTLTVTPADLQKQAQQAAQRSRDGAVSDGGKKDGGVILF
jgi:hypothetical protein